MENSTDYEYLLQSSYSNLAFVCVVLIFIVESIGVTGNISIIVVYFFRIKDRGERYYIPLLAVVDLLACVTSFPYILMDKEYLYNYPSEFACRIFSMLRLFLPGISAFIFLLISIQRYLLICKALPMTLFWKRLCFVLACGIVTIGTAPILWKSGVRISEESYMNTNITVRVCKFSVEPSLGTIVYFGMMLLVIFCCIILAVFLYIPVLKQVNMYIHSRRHTISNIDRKNENKTVTETENEEIMNMKIMNASNTSTIQLPDLNASQNQHLQSNISGNSCDDNSSRHNFLRGKDGIKEKSKIDKRLRRPKRELLQRKLTMMFFLLFLIYIISYIPPLVLLILTYSIENFKYSTLLRTEALVWIYVPQSVMLNHMVNPFMYGYYDAQFRKQLISCFKKRIHTV